MKQTIYKYILPVLFSLVISFTGFAQQIKGTVYYLDEHSHKSPLPGTNVYWENTPKGVVTDAEGNFKIEKYGAANKLVFSFMGYKNDTVQVNFDMYDLDVMLYPLAKNLSTVTITEKASKNFLEKSNPINAEIISGKDLVKAACCNLSESFENSASVDVSYSDAITGAKQIELLGLAGIYTQILSDNVPAVRGLATPYGLGYIPGSWMNSIQVSKGTASVKNGFESISGQINVHYKEPDETEKLFINLYGNSFYEGEVNIMSGYKFNNKWSTSLLLHGNNAFRKMDMNHDNFLDMPLTSQVNVMNRWKYFDEHTMFHFDLKVLHEDRPGGQATWSKELPSDTIHGYGIEVKTDRIEANGKLGFIGHEKPYQSLALIASGVYHHQHSIYGLNYYDAVNQYFYGNLIYQSIINTTDHKFNTGLSYILDDYLENLNDSIMPRQESIPGAYFEYTYNYMDKVTLIAGIRDDYHNLYGNFFTPRFHFKYHPNNKTVIKLSAGKGYRVANLLAENTALLITSKKLVFKENILPEESWNFGLYLNRDITINKVKYSFKFDYFRTNFINQVIIDLDQDPSYVFFYNLDGKSFSNSLQGELNFKPFKGLDITMAYRWNDVWATYHGKLKERPLMKRSKALLAISYATKFEKWQIDYALQYNGKSRLPEVIQTESSGFSPDYVLMNMQLTKRFKKTECYAGVENLTDFVQKSPIISADKPFSKEFDASEIWGPVIGRKIYFGIRFTLNND